MLPNSLCQFFLRKGIEQENLTTNLLA